MAIFFVFSFSYCVKSIVWTLLDITSLEIDCKKWQFDLHGCRAIVNLQLRKFYT
jgi:hypothetical protein